MLELLKINRIKTKFINYLHYQISHSSISLGELAIFKKRRRRDMNTSLVHGESRLVFTKRCNAVVDSEAAVKEADG